MSFAAGINRFKKMTGETAVKAVGDVIEEAVDGVVDRTPKDSGNAAANWTVDERVNYSWDENNESWRANRSKQKRKVQKLAKKVVEKGIDVNVSNPTPYAYRLERGDSKKAPNGMVDLTIMNIKHRRTT